MVNVGLGSETVPNHGHTLFVTSIVMVILSGLFVCARIAVRLARKTMGIDDYITLVALANLIALSLTECLAVVNGYGKHMKDLKPHERVLAFKWFFGAQITYKIAVGLYKLSFLFCYLRIFIDKGFRWLCYCMVGLVTTSTTAFTLVTIWQCKPLQTFWNRRIPGGRCFDSEAFWFSYSLINILLDVAILSLPVRQVLKLQVNSKEKLSLIAVFFLGIFVCLTSIIRTTTLSAAAKSKDATWSYIPPTVWSVIEANTGLICASLPMLKQPLAAMFPRVFMGSSAGHSRRTRYYWGRHSNSAWKSKSPSRTGNSTKIESIANSNRPIANEYDQWALEDGTMVASSVGSEDQERISEERAQSEKMKPVADGVAIMMTKDVEVNVEMEPPLPSVKNFPGIRDPRIHDE